MNSQPGLAITGLLECNVTSYYFRRTNEILWESIGQKVFTKKVIFELVIEKDVLDEEKKSNMETQERSVQVTTSKETIKVKIFTDIPQRYCRLSSSTPQ